MAETDIEKEFLKNHKNEHVQFKLKTLPVNPAAIQKEQSRPSKAMYVNFSQGYTPFGAHL